MCSSDLFPSHDKPKIITAINNITIKKGLQINQSGIKIIETERKGVEREEPQETEVAVEVARMAKEKELVRELEMKIIPLWNNFFLLQREFLKNLT